MHRVVVGSIFNGHPSFNWEELRSTVSPSKDCSRLLLCSLLLLQTTSSCGTLLSGVSAVFLFLLKGCRNDDDKRTNMKTIGCMNKLILIFNRRLRSVSSWTRCLVAALDVRCKWFSCFYFAFVNQFSVDFHKSNPRKHWRHSSYVQGTIFID